MKQSKDSINEYAKQYNTVKDFDRFFIDWRYRTLVGFRPKFGEVLEFGCADGLMTKRLAAISRHVDVVEGSRHYIALTKKRLGRLKPKADFFHQLFADFATDKRYDCIVLSSVLHEVDDPVKVLRKARSLLKKGGIIYINVPNTLSLHRRIGRIMGLLKTEYDFNERDKKFLHQRVYDSVRLRREIQKAGLRTIKKGGYFLKIMSNRQLQRLEPKLLDALYEVSAEVPPDICAEIYAFCSLKGEGRGRKRR